MSDIRHHADTSSSSLDNRQKLNIHITPLDAKSKTCLEDLVALCKEMHVDLSSPSLTDKLIELWHLCVHQVMHQNGLSSSEKNMKESFASSPFDHAFAVLKHHLLAHKCDHALVNSLHDLVRDHCEIHSPCPKSSTQGKSKYVDKSAAKHALNKMSSSPSCTTCSVAGSNVPTLSGSNTVGRPPRQPLDASKSNSSSATTSSSVASKTRGSLGKQMRPRSGALKPVSEDFKNRQNLNKASNSASIVGQGQKGIQRDIVSNIDGSVVLPTLVKDKNLVNAKSYDMNSNISHDAYIVSNSQMKPIFQRRHTKQFGDKLVKPKYHASASSASLTHSQSKKELEWNKITLSHSLAENADHAHDHELSGAEWEDEVYDEVSMLIPRSGGLAAVASVFRHLSNKDIEMSHDKKRGDRMIGERTVGRHHQHQNLPKQKSACTSSTTVSSGSDCSSDSIPACTSGNLMLLESRMRVPSYSSASFRFKSKGASKQKTGEHAAAKAQVLKAAARAAVVLDQNPLGAGNRLKHNFSRSRLDIDSLYEFNGVLHCSEEIGIPCKGNMIANNPHLTHVLYGAEDTHKKMNSKSATHHHHGNVTLNASKKGFDEKDLESSCKRDVDLERFEREKFGEDIPKSVHNCGVCHAHVM